PGFDTLDEAMAAAGGGFASGTPGVPLGRWFDVGENGREMMRYWGGNRLEVASNQQTRRFLSDGAGGPAVIIYQTNNIPERADPRRTQAGISRTTQAAVARAARTGLAVHGTR